MLQQGYKVVHILPNHVAVAGSKDIHLVALEQLMACGSYLIRVSPGQPGELIPGIDLDIRLHILLIEPSHPQYAVSR